MSRRIVSLGLVGILASFLHEARQVVGGPIRIVSPSMYADMEAGYAITSGGTEGRWQHVFPASDFEHLPAGYRLITHVAWRPNGTLSNPLTTTFGSLLMRMSTTSFSPPDLSPTFADNIGVDEIVVFDGPLTVATANVGPAGGPKEFDFAFSLETPFEYDPSAGNLLMDVTYVGLSASHSFDFVRSADEGTQFISNGDLTAVSRIGEWGGIVWQFAFEEVPGVGSLLQPGDADQNREFDQLDLVQVLIAGKYMTGEPATWGEGDWDGAPGGEPGNPPPGDGLFDRFDIVKALTPGHYLTGRYVALAPGGTPQDKQTSIIHNAITGEVAVDAPSGQTLTSINIDSASGIFTGQPAQNLGGSFDNDVDTNIFKATFGSSFGSVTFGPVAQTALSEEFVAGDLTVVGSLEGGGDLGEVDLIYIPEPSAIVLVTIGLAGMLPMALRRRSR